MYKKVEKEERRKEKEQEKKKGNPFYVVSLLGLYSTVCNFSRVEKERG